MPKDPTDLPEIPVLDTGPEFPIETLEREPERARKLLDAATRLVPRAGLRALDAVSRRWLAKWANPALPEIDQIAARLGRPGAYFLSVNYEWGCTVCVGPAPVTATARLVRVLDWATPGLGRNVVAARVRGAAGPFVTLTWPGYTGVLQAMAPGRFAAALNQAPMQRRRRRPYALDWAANRARVWRSPDMMAAHVLRHVFEAAPDFAAAKQTLVTTPIAAPAIFSLTGVAADETIVIERTETGARVHRGPVAAANHWLARDWTGQPRGYDSLGRARAMGEIAPDLEASFAWLTPPILNPRTRLVMAADAGVGRLEAQGFEAMRPATSRLSIPC